MSVRVTESDTPVADPRDAERRLCGRGRGAAGDDKEARRVLVAKQRRRCGLGPFGKIVGYSLDGIVCYGYRPAQPVCRPPVLGTGVCRTSCSRRAASSVRR
jgi:hypothetical protein